MTRKVYGALGIIALASTLCIAPASAGPCAGEVADFRSSLRETKTVNPPSSVRRRNQSARNLNTSRRVNRSNTQRSRPRRKS